MGEAAGDLAARRAKALERCAQQVEWYERHARIASRSFTVFQAAAIVLGALTPVLILVTNLPKAVQALPAALASIAAGLVAMFRWLENRTRFSYTAEALKSERLKFETRTTPSYATSLADERALENFVARIEEISLREVAEWRSQLAEPRGRENASGD